jgi:hypothetical protein
MDIYLCNVNISCLWDAEPPVFLKKKMCIMFNTRQNRPEYYNFSSRYWYIVNTLITNSVLGCHSIYLLS